MRSLSLCTGEPCQQRSGSQATPSDQRAIAPAVVELNCAKVVQQ